MFISVCEIQKSNDPTVSVSQVPIVGPQCLLRHPTSTTLFIIITVFVIRLNVVCVLLCDHYRGGHGRRLLLQAICNTGSSSSSNSVSAKVGWVVPLVCDQLWAQILQQYPHSQLKILVDQNRSLVMTHNRSCSECKCMYNIIQT